MKHDEAVNKLYSVVSSADALEIIDSIDRRKYVIFGVEGMYLLSNGDLRGNLDLIFNVGNMLNISPEEKWLFVRTFVRNRMSDDTVFEVFGEEIE